MADENLFEQLKSVLGDLQTFLSDNIEKIKPAVNAIAAVVPQVNELIDLLIDLLGKMKTAVEELDLGVVEGLEELSTFTGQIPALLDAAKKLLPDETSTIEDIADTTDIVTSLPSVGDVKTEITALIDAIVADLQQLKA